MINYNQNQILNIIEQYTPNFGLSEFLFIYLPDLCIFFGLLFILTILSFNYYKISNLSLFTLLLKSSQIIFIFVILLLSLSIIITLVDSNSIISLFKTYNIFNYTYQFNMYTQVFKLIIIITIFILNSFLSFQNIKNCNNIAELLLLIYIVITLSFIIISCTHYGILLLALEGFSLSLYILTTFDRMQGGITAAVKYFSFGTLGSIFLFWGVVHIYALIPSLSYNAVFSLSNILLIGIQTNPILESLEFATTSILVGFLIKLGAAPTHQWVADVYTGVNLYVTAVFSTIIKYVIFVIFCRTAYQLPSTYIIEIFAIISLFVGSIITLKQTEIKRFLAYSSITHVGFLLIGDLNSSFIYIFTYILSSLLFFSVLLSTKNYNKELIYLSDLRSLKKTNNWSSMLLVLALASMAGLPPFSGFFGKFLIWGSLIEDILLFNSIYSYTVIIVSILLTLITIFYYMRLIIYLYSSTDNEIIFNNQINTEISYSLIKSDSKKYQIQSILSFFILFWLVFQSTILGIITTINQIIILG